MVEAERGWRDAAPLSRSYSLRPSTDAGAGSLSDAGSREATQDGNFTDYTRLDPKSDIVTAARLAFLQSSQGRRRPPHRSASD